QAIDRGAAGRVQIHAQLGRAGARVIGERARIAAIAHLLVATHLVNAVWVISRTVVASGAGLGTGVRWKVGAAATTVWIERIRAEAGVRVALAGVAGVEPGAAAQRAGANALLADVAQSAGVAVVARVAVWVPRAGAVAEQRAGAIQLCTGGHRAGVA